MVTIKGRRYRVREPDPTVSAPILTAALRLLGPWIGKFLSGTYLRVAPALCPECGAKDAEAINGRRWLCNAQVQRGQQLGRCAKIWDQVLERDAAGKPVPIGLAWALEQPEWRARLAVELEGALERLDPHEAADLWIQILVPHADYETSGQWAPMRSADTLNRMLPNGMAILRLVKAAAEAWILPSLVDDWTDTSPDSSTAETPGASQDPPPATTTAGTRAPPPVKRRG